MARGGVLSCLPEIPADVILGIDRDPAIGQWLNFSANALSDQTTVQGCESLIFSPDNPIYALADKQDNSNITRDIQAEKRYLAEKHFLSSQDRYNDCQKALKTKRIIAITSDIGDINPMMLVGEAIKRAGSEVTFGNLTNVWEFVGNQLAEVLRKLPVNPNAIFLHSSFAYNFRRRGHAHPEAQWKIQGLEKFIQEEEREYKLYQESKHPDRFNYQEF